MDEIIGVAGCGRMGTGMLANLRKAGIDARGYDIRPIDGVGTDIDAFCDGLTMLISVVRDAAETDTLLFDDQAVISQAKSLRHVIICSTLSPKYVIGLRQRIPDHIALTDAPMSGAQIKADAGTLTFMTGGDISAVQPLLQAMGQEVHQMGDFGAGMTAKVLNNLLAASHTAMTRLVLDWADEAGLDEDRLLKLIHTASGQNWLASGLDEIEFARDGYAPDNTIGILVKDVTAAMDLATDDAALPKAVRTAIRNLKPRSRLANGS
ncbi:NAD(P)-binding domain-containing protein [Cognatiyoonia sp. IB215446]|uniref:NAD(P)-dependent oxidoreductase n=1 Tax=Cognatiyoonia sp. IB215446 TaxID=3097355 RepID=UPI002A0E5802|nr:NAD(P)-binding domain-containing protein [Cognatiyoonia sp. IB215446]MDX8347266.1 NAD(P)-binding domain-containing protein [Cognatiyoonia sp. IB215446]